MPQRKILIQSQVLGELTFVFPCRPHQHSVTLNDRCSIANVLLWNGSSCELLL